MDLLADRLYSLWNYLWRRLSWQMLFIFGVGIFLWRNLLFPMVADDYSYAFIWDGANAGNLLDGIGARQRITSIADIVTSQWSHYFTWGGRVPSLFIAQFFAWQGNDGILFDLFNTVAFAVLVLILFWLAAGKIQSPAKSKAGLLLILLGLFFSVPSYMYTMIWLTGACVYLWTAIAECAFMLPYCLAFWQASFWAKAGPWHSIFMLLLGIFAGWSVEPGAIITTLMIIVLLLLFYRQKKLRSWQLAGFIGLLIGLSLLMMAPGSLMRLKIMQELEAEYTMPPELLWTADMFLYNFFEGFLPVFTGELPLLIPIGIYFWKSSGNKELTRYILLFTAGSILLLCAMLFSPDFRAHAGYHSVIFLLVASTAALRSLLPMIKVWCEQMPKVRLGVALLGCLSIGIWLITSILCLIIETSYANQWAVRHQIIAKHKEDNLIVVPAIKIPWHLDKITGNRSVTDMLLMFGGDLESNPTDNRSNMFAQYYGLKGIIIDKRVDWGKYGEVNEW
ncbi:DUF6056 family protein [uncultured Anaerovibrio sp.]|uniref:DUF3329 domain-containing protein n=1 Tax=uncultured Anaerovibrio sp. TaxID=361586 RepID=UPI002634416F|nr:DUF6056 family protein [uncultured Anaerovibrio sp.]